MRLTLDPKDLKPEFQKHDDSTISASKVTFEHLNPTAQNAVRAVGRATYYAWGGETYNAIYPPAKPTAEPTAANTQP